MAGHTVGTDAQRWHAATNVTVCCRVRRYQKRRRTSMCIMEVRPGQRASTIAQAMAHNTSTVERDLDMFEELLRARGDSDSLAIVSEAHNHLRHAYAALLAQFGAEVAAEVADDAGHVHNHDHGNERSFVEQAHHDAQLARRFETR